MFSCLARAFFIYTFYSRFTVMMDEPRFAQPIPNVTVAMGRDANLPCVVEHLGSYKVGGLNGIMLLLIHDETKPN